MRSSDFSKVPPVGKANAMFVGATRYRGPLSILHVTRRWRRLIKKLEQSPGYRWHRIYYEFPFTLGTIAFFDDAASLLRFARSEEHRELMMWVTTGDRHATGGYIRIYDARPQGYTNGVWRSEEPGMQHIERFTAVSGEHEGPLVEEPS